MVFVGQKKTKRKKSGGGWVLLRQSRKRGVCEAKLIRSQVNRSCVFFHFFTPVDRWKHPADRRKPCSRAGAKASEVPGVPSTTDSPSQHSCNKNTYVQYSTHKHDAFLIEIKNCELSFHTPENLSSSSKRGSLQHVLSSSQVPWSRAVILSSPLSPTASSVSSQMYGQHIQQSVNQPGLLVVSAHV